MNLSKLKKTVKELVNKERKGNKIKHKKIVKVLEKLEAKKKDIKSKLNHEKSKKVQKDLNLELKVVRAQIKKAHRLLKKPED